MSARRSARRSITWDEALEAYDLHLRAKRAAKGTLDDHRLYPGLFVHLGPPCA